MRHFVVIVTFPKAPAGIAQHESRQDAVDVGAALRRAFEDARQQVRKRTKHRGLDKVGKISWQEIEPATAAEAA